MLAIFQNIDDVVFFKLNSLMVDNYHMQALMAVLNHRLETKIDSLVALTVSIINIFLQSDKKKCFKYTVYFWLMFQIVFYSQNYFFNHVLPNRLSPTAIYKNAVILSQVLHDTAIKDGTLSSFPGGHAFALICWALLNRHLSSKFLGNFFLLFAIIMTVPRLVVGAHWLSDIAAGALLAVLSSKAILWLGTWFSAWFTKHLK